METKKGKHFDDDTLELYSMGRLPEEAVPGLEEHLMLCRDCQQRLAQAEDFLEVVQAATGQVRREELERPRKERPFAWIFGVPKPVWAGAFAVLALTVTIPVLYHPGYGNLSRSEVELRTSRGPGEETAVNAAAGRVVVVADVSELRQLPSYLVRLVDQSGSEVWRGSAQAVDQKIRQEISKPIGPGRYWVRLYSSDGSDLLREYALYVK